MGWADKPVFPKLRTRISEMQKRSAYHLFKAAAMFFRIPIPGFDLGEEHKALGERRLSYSGDAVSVRQDVEADLVIPAWPKVGEA